MSSGIPTVVELLAAVRRPDREGSRGRCRPAERAGAVRIRAVRIPSARVASIVPRDLNIVLERLEPLAADERFDIIVATNISSTTTCSSRSWRSPTSPAMLRPGGLFLTNTPVPPIATDDALGSLYHGFLQRAGRPTTCSGTSDSRQEKGCYHEAQMTPASREYETGGTKGTKGRRRSACQQAESAVSVRRAAADALVLHPEAGFVCL